MKGKNCEDVNQRIDDCIEELRVNGYKLHHTAWAGGYLTRKPESVVIRRHLTRQFNGYVIEAPSFASSRHHIRFYFVKKY